MECINCQYQNPDFFRFCGMCGHPLKNRAEADLRSLPRSADAELRHLTVMFCDLVGSTYLSERMELEDFRELIRAYQDASSYIVRKYGGHLAQYLGDGILVYFGYPAAHQDDPVRAVRAGLEIVAEMEQLSALRAAEDGTDLSVRVGIHAGPVVVGELGFGERHEMLALGRTPNVAARLQSIATPNSVVVSENLHQLIRIHFVSEPLGEFQLKGITRPVRVHHILHDSGYYSSFQVQVKSPSTPVIGREKELRQLRLMWEKAKSGRGQCVLITGEHGSGKSRLIRVLEEYLESEVHNFLSANCVSYQQNSPLHPVISLLRRLLKIEITDSPAARLEKIKNILGSFGFDSREVTPYLASFLSIPQSGESSHLTITPESLRKKTLQILIQWMFRVSDRKPLLFVLEDLQWADPTTLYHVQEIQKDLNGHHILLILTSDPNFRHPLKDNREIRKLRLDRLQSAQVRMMIREITHGKDFPEQLVDLIFRKTDGIPLFVEELVHYLKNTGSLTETEADYRLAVTGEQLVIPESIQDTLMARLDNLGSLKKIVQVAAVIGREFELSVLDEVLGSRQEDLQEEMIELVDRDIFIQRGNPDDHQYVFKQTLLQETAYQSLIRNVRRTYHSRTAHILERRFKDGQSVAPEIIALHFREIRNFERAITYLLQAGREDLRRSAHHEAISHLREALELAEQLDESSRRQELEIELYLTLAVPLVATKGYGDDEIAGIYHKARLLSQKAGKIPRIFPALYGLFRYYLITGKLEAAMDINELLLSWAQTSRNPGFLLEAHRSTGILLFHMGDLKESYYHLREACLNYDQKKHREHALIFSTDPKVSALSYCALNLCTQGCISTARKAIRQAREHAQNLGHPFSLAFAYNHIAWIYQILELYDRLPELLSALNDISRKEGFTFWQATHDFLHSWEDVTAGALDRAVSRTLAAIEKMKEVGTGLIAPYFYAVTARLYQMNRDRINAGKLIRQAAESARLNNEHFYDAEILRIKASIEADPAKRVRLLERGISVTQRQNTFLFELNIRLDLYQLRRSHPGNVERIRELLTICETSKGIPVMQRASKVVGTLKNR